MRRVLCIVVGVGAKATVSTDVDLAHCAMRETGDQVVVDARQVVEALGRLVDQLQGRVVEDVAVVNRNDHDNLVGAAEILLDPVVGLDIGVFLWQQVVEVGVDLQLRHVQREQQRKAEDRDQHRAGTRKDPGFAAL